MDNEDVGVKFSEFPSETPENTDEVVGLHAGDNARFSVANFILAIRQGLANIFVPLTRTINEKPLDKNITLDASDVGAIDADDVGVADGVASLDNTGKVPSTQLPSIPSDASDITYDPITSGLTATDVQAAIDEVVDDLGNKQASITANGILKGDGQGGVSAATAGTDYQTPLTAGTDYATPGQLADKASKADLTNIQATGTTNTTGAAIPAGAYFYLNGVLHIAKTQINVNATFTVNTNCEQVSDGGLNDTTVIDLSSSVSINTTNLSGIDCSLKVRKKLVQFTAVLTPNSLTSLHNKELAYLPPLGDPASIIYINAIWVQDYRSGTTQTKSILLVIDTQGRLRVPNQGGYDGTASTTNSRIFLSVSYFTA